MRLEFIAQWALYSFFFYHRCHAKCVISFSLFSHGDPDGRSISNFCRFVSSCRWWITLTDYTASNCFVSKNQFCNVSFIEGMLALKRASLVSAFQTVYCAPLQKTSVQYSSSEHTVQNCETKPVQSQHSLKRKLIHGCTLKFTLIIHAMQSYKHHLENHCYTFFLKPHCLHF